MVDIPRHSSSRQQLYVSTYHADPCFLTLFSVPLQIDLAFHQIRTYCRTRIRKIGFVYIRIDLQSQSVTIIPTSQWEIKQNPFDDSGRIMYSFTRLCVQRVACGLIRQDKRLKGHAKWQNIAHTKALKDAEKSALTLAFSRRIKVAVAAKKKNIPIATLHGVLEKLEKSKTKSQTEFVDFRGPGGAYFIVKILSHNVVGAKMMLNTLFKKMKCKSIEGKSKGTLFEHLGCIITEHKDTLDSATEDAIAVGADDVEEFEADGKFYRASFFIF
ncbi:hypothetical protein G9C98_008112 [Cotesia typhae]|uniref:TACO1/YebC-like second and third domain-containing protein n=1 Tax=Cotesia typhae TaxID=2053667 RepID=A0A8J5VBI2_9HYME|nr:hypothetical protein G9C98_008112 [Cotesia typhae]